MRGQRYLLHETKNRYSQVDMSTEFDWLFSSCGYAGDAKSLFALAKDFESEGNLHLAATAYDLAFRLDSDDEEIKTARKQLLDQLAVTEHGIKFRYIPAGSFLMGSVNGDPDEQPVHQVQLREFWLSETPVSWATYCDLMDWAPPPASFPSGEGNFHLREENKIRLQYCEDATTRARDWHAHEPGLGFVNMGTGERNPVKNIFGEPPREDPRRPWKYDRKPMVSISWQEAEEMCERISDSMLSYRLPTEAEWEKAARGGLINNPYPWGDAQPSESWCDFNRFDEFSILPMRRFPPNAYGLYAMSGCVWEWTSDWYDAQYYAESSSLNPTGPSTGSEKVLRGGSWSDCAEALTVSFRMSRGANSWRDGSWGHHFAPNIGFRLCRVERSAKQ
jgi:formylglycine-generating enzyme